MSFAKLIATWFGLGLIPAAPGTWGSLGAVLVAWVLMRFTGCQPWWLAVLAALMTPLGIWAADRAANEAAKKDPQFVVVDEVLGQWLVLAAMNPLAESSRQWIAAFALFRIFDIWKPFPVRRLEKLPGGTGIVADDLGAGVYGALVMLGARALGWL